jgi:ubiquinone biosynthesis monooxygenase Coq7
MTSDARVARQHLRVMHACEKGATGVYWGHRAVASIFYRSLIPQLTQMHAHEVEHFALFGALMKRRGIRGVFAPVLWCAGGIIYGIATGIGGPRAVWKSTAVIESIVEKELLEAAQFFQSRDPETYALIQLILEEETEHKRLGEAQAPGQKQLDGLVSSAAHAGATASKKLAERL